MRHLGSERHSPVQWWSLGGEGDSLSREQRGRALVGSCGDRPKRTEPSHSSMRPHRGARRETPPAGAEPQPSRERVGSLEPRASWFTAGGCRTPRSVITPRERTHRDGGTPSQVPHPSAIKQSLSTYAGTPRTCTFILGPGRGSRPAATAHTREFAAGPCPPLPPLPC